MLEVFSLRANVADVKSLAIHPATTHSQFTAEELEDQNIHPNTLRLSIGTEHIDDIIGDLEKGFAASEDKHIKQNTILSPHIIGPVEFDGANDTNQAKPIYLQDKAQRLPARFTISLLTNDIFAQKLEQPLIHHF